MEKNCLFNKIKCLVGWHKWFYPAKHGIFALAWKRCRRCGFEAPNNMPIEEYKKLIELCRRR